MAAIVIIALTKLSRRCSVHCPVLRTHFADAFSGSRVADVSSDSSFVTSARPALGEVEEARQTFVATTTSDVRTTSVEARRRKRR